MSDTALAALQTRIDQLTTDNTNLKAEAKDRRHKGAELKKQNEKLTKDLETITVERDDLKVSATKGPKELNDKIADLEGKLRSRDHRDAFAKVKEFKVKGEGEGDDAKEVVYTLNEGVDIPAVWKHLEYKAEGDAPDEAKITGLLAGAIKTSSFLFKPKGDAPESEAGASKNPITTQRREPGPGSGTQPNKPASERPSLSATIATDYAKTGRTIPGRL
jgi:FtsZ-binding cell division protein ZapB